VVAGAGVALAAGGGDGGGPEGPARDEQAAGVAASGGEPRFDEHLAQRSLATGRKTAATTTSTIVTAGDPTDGSAGADGGGAATESRTNCEGSCGGLPSEIPPFEPLDPADYACPENWEYDPGSGRMVNTGCAGIHQPSVSVTIIPPPPPPPVVLPETPTTTTTAPPPTSPPTTGAG
jgi:hypothetical protein